MQKASAHFILRIRRLGVRIPSRALRNPEPTLGITLINHPFGSVRAYFSLSNRYQYVSGGGVDNRPQSTLGFSSLGLVVHFFPLGDAVLRLGSH